MEKDQAGGAGSPASQAPEVIQAEVQKVLETLLKIKKTPQAVEALVSATVSITPDNVVQLSLNGKIITFNCTWKQVQSYMLAGNPPSSMQDVASSAWISLKKACGSAAVAKDFIASKLGQDLASHQVNFYSAGKQYHYDGLTWNQLYNYVQGHSSVDPWPPFYWSPPKKKPTPMQPKSYLIPPLDQATWDNMSGKARWDSIVALRGPDFLSSNGIKWFTTSIIRHRLSGIMRVGGLVNREFGLIILPWLASKGIFALPGHATGKFDSSHFFYHVSEAAQWLSIPATTIPADIYLEKIIKASEYFQPAQLVKNIMPHAKSHQSVMDAYLIDSGIDLPPGCGKTLKLDPYLSNQDQDQDPPPPEEDKEEDEKDEEDVDKDDISF